MNEKALHDILQILKERKPEFESGYGVTAIGIFGSLARGEERYDSDGKILYKYTEVDWKGAEEMRDIISHHYCMRYAKKSSHRCTRRACLVVDSDPGIAEDPDGQALRATYGMKSAAGTPEIGLR